MSRYADNVSDFFREYIKTTKSGYTESGNLTESCIKDAANFLLDQHVFDSISDMREQALKDYSIILPESIFEKG